MKQKTLYEIYQNNRGLTANNPNEYNCTDFDLADFEIQVRREMARETKQKTVEKARELVNPIYVLNWLFDWLAKEAKA